MHSRWCKECGVLHGVDAWPHAGGHQTDLRADLAQVYASEDVRPQRKGGRYVKCRCGCGDIFNLAAWPHNHPWPYQIEEARSDLPSPQVVRDGLPDIMNPLNGRPIDSKRALRKQYRAAGVEEVGADKSHVRRERYKVDRAGIVKDVKRVLETWKSDNLSNDQMDNMLREQPPSAMGMQCGIGFEAPTD